MPSRKYGREREEKKKVAMRVLKGLQLVADYQRLLCALSCLTGMKVDDLCASFSSWVGVRPLHWREGMKVCMDLTRSGEPLPWEGIK